MTAPVADPAAAYYTAQAATAAQTAATVAAAWEAVDLAVVDDSFAAVRDQILAAIIAGQVRSASIAPLYLGRVLANDGLSPDPLAAIPPTAFAGRSAGGWSLTVPIRLAPIRFKQSIARGEGLERASQSALAHLTEVASTEVADAGRGAMEAAVRLEPQIIGYERYVNMPACSRCILLAGRVYRKSEGFPRHPKCDCSHRPLTSREARDGTDQEPSSLFRSLTTEEQDRLFTPAGARAIRAGADLGQIVNARSGMSTPGDPFTTQGRGRRRRGQKRQSRLSPQGVARMAGEDEQRYLELLRANRYIT